MKDDEKDLPLFGASGNDVLWNVHELMKKRRKPAKTAGMIPDTKDLWKGYIKCVLLKAVGAGR